jgi:RNA polymerase sigma factor (sigma-70 family)
MAIHSLSSVIQHLRRTLLPEGEPATDGQLLEAFLHRRDENAFAHLLSRHGPMVWAVCRRVLGNGHDAEDAFQAAFLVLVRKADTIRPRNRVGHWLYGVAYNTAIKARDLACKRQRRERLTATLPEPASPVDENNLSALVDQEVLRLPEKYRLPIVLCDLQGHTRQEAAQHLGWPPGTVAGRLARAREMLKRRLARHGLELSAIAAIPLPSGLAATSIEQTRAAGLLGSLKEVPPTIHSLVREVLQTMFYKRLLANFLIGCVFLSLAALAGFGTALLSSPRMPQAPTAPVSQKPAVSPNKKTPKLAWGETLNGIQYGIAFPAANKTTYRIGDTLTLVLKGRNATDKPMDFAFDHIKEPQQTLMDTLWLSTPPDPANPDGDLRKFSLNLPYYTIPSKSVRKRLKPGEVVDLDTISVQLIGVNLEEDPKTGLPKVIDDQRDGTKFPVRPGTFTLHWQHWRPWSATQPYGWKSGELPLVIEEAEEKPLPSSKEKIAWGKPALGSGLEYGISLRGNASGVLSLGATMTVDLHARNPTDKPVQFTFEKPETGDGTWRDTPYVEAVGGEKAEIHPPFPKATRPPFKEVAYDLKPGEAVRLMSSKIPIRLWTEKGNADVPTLFAQPGTYTIQYRDDKNTFTIPIWATGKRKIEIRSASSGMSQ